MIKKIRWALKSTLIGSKGALIPIQTEWLMDFLDSGDKGSKGNGAEEGELKKQNSKADDGG